MAARPKGPRPGRPSRLLTDSARKALLKAVRNGCPFKFAAAAADVAHRTLQTWIRQGRHDEKAGKDSIYRTFLRDLTREESKGVAARLELIMRAAQTDWRAAHAINLSRHPEHFDANRHEIKALRKEVSELHQLLRVLAPLPASTPPVGPAPPDQPAGEGGS